MCENSNFNIVGIHFVIRFIKTLRSYGTRKIKKYLCLARTSSKLEKSSEFEKTRLDLELTFIKTLSRV